LIAADHIGSPLAAKK